jgi:hypothetical protein
MNPKIFAHKQRLDNLYSKVAVILVPQDQVEWSKYLCVLTAGFIEESLRVLILDFEKEISYVTNCKTERILEVLNKFNSNWGSTFETEIKDNSPIDKEIKDSIDSIVSNRHLIAHGKSVGVSYSTVKKYYGYCTKAIEILEDTIQ